MESANRPSAARRADATRRTARDSLRRMRNTGAAQAVRLRETAEVVDINKGVLSFGSTTLLVGATALAGLLFWGWKTGQELPLWPALLVAAVNVFGAVKLVMETRARQTARQASAAAAADAAQHQRKGKAKG